MTISEQIDEMIAELKSKGQKPETIIMGRQFCIQWLVESTQGESFVLNKNKRYDFTYKKIPVVVCLSGILEVVPNAKALLNG